MRKRTQRQHYPLVSGLALIAARSSKPNQATTTNVVLLAYEALEALRVGAMTKSTWELLANAVNAAQVLAVEKRLGHDYRDDIAAAKQAMVNIGARAKANGMRFVAKADELNALRTMLAIHEAQIEAATAGDMSDVAFRIEQLIASGDRAKP